MPPRTILLGSTFVIGLIAFLGARAFSDRMNLSANAEAATTKSVESDLVISVPVPMRVIAAGERLMVRDFKRIPVSKSLLPERYLASIDDYSRYTSRIELAAMVPVQLSAISQERSDMPGVVTRIPAGMRAITVRVDAESAVEGWARSGDFVDVILVRISKDSGSGLESAVIAENVKILSAGSSTVPLASSEAAPAPPTTATLLVSQEDALKVKTAANIGKLTFALRGKGDEAPTLARFMDQRRIVPAPQGGSLSKRSFAGKARGPDGKLYLLPKDSQWVRAAGSLEREVSVGVVQGPNSSSTRESVETETPQSEQLVKHKSDRETK